MKLYTFLILIIIIIIFFKLTTYKENYDGVIRNVSSIEDCADIASSVYDVSAFGYDPVDNNCYISKTSLTKPPIQIHPYHNEFKVTDKICNKYIFLKKSREDITTNGTKTNSLIANRLYDCYTNTQNGDDNSIGYYFEKNKPAKLVDSRDELEKLSVTKHNMFDINWPTEKKELNDINILYSINVDKKIINSDIYNISWNPKIKSSPTLQNPLDVYSDKDNFNLFKLNKNKCIETVKFENPSYFDIYYKKLN
jgi:hypothetical protein